MLQVKRSERGFDTAGGGGTGDRCWPMESRFSLVGLHVSTTMHTDVQQYETVTNVYCVLKTDSLNHHVESWQKITNRVTTESD